MLITWRFTAHSFLLFQLLAVAFLSGVGLVVGGLWDSYRRERALRRLLADAIRDMSAATDATEVRRALLETAQQIAPGRAFEVRDETGVLAGAHPAAGGWRRWLNPAATWDERALHVDGRALGVLRWRPGRSGRAANPMDEALVATVDLAAAALGRIRLADEKAQMEDAARTEQLRMVLLDAVSHHFRSPLAGILGSVTTILDLPEPHDRKVRAEFLSIIKEQANRLSRYVENFLSLARLEAGAIEVNLGEVNIETLVYDVWDTFGEIGGERRYLQVDVESGAIRSDPLLLGQVFGNVLENAIKYSPEESLVEVRGRRRDDRLMIEISDQGCGAPAASLPRMFGRFYRSHTVQAPGIGLGLHITRSLVEMLGGEVSAHARPDGAAGLVIAVELPLATATAS